jgi:integrase
MRVRDLWLDSQRRMTARHPDRGGNRDSCRWLACWTGPDGREKTRAFRTKDAATRYARRMESDLDRGEYIDPDSGKVLLGPVALRWLAQRQVGASSARHYESVYRLHVAPAFADRRVKSILVSDVIEWLKELAGTYSTSTQVTAYMILAGALDLAAADGLRRGNPARDRLVRVPVASSEERPSWETGRVVSVIDAHALAYRVLPVLAAGCGLRGGEAFGIAIEDFDFDAGKVAVQRQVTRIGGQFVFKLPKGGKERTVPLADGVASYVRAHVDAFPPAPYELPWMDERGKLASEPRPCGLLVRWAGDDPRTHGKHVVASSFDQFVWKPVLASLGIIPPAAKDKGGIWRYQGGTRHDGLHSLRHWYASCLLNAGVSLAGVMEFMGHSRKGKPITLGTYGHVDEETFAAARAAVDQRLFPLRSVGASGPAKMTADGTVAELRRPR